MPFQDRGVASGEISKSIGGIWYNNNNETKLAAVLSTQQPDVIEQQQQQFGEVIKCFSFEKGVHLQQQTAFKLLYRLKIKYPAEIASHYYILRTLIGRLAG
ncbi:hypothetical protein T4B_3131 [Trichinella pseudospiralis]|uniref:Uncharacterized protein n=1 Tax=Trichinella pseudospiralis TaxID=6337 RepID=A0A0V1IKG3_TRIPS|nr:hypothetical protein T4A_12948 [Trichinella pseudospiralis]KRZ23307.1 hypothetical protein T4B_3131 [Trichinella pseudospiralis]